MKVMRVMGTQVIKKQTNTKARTLTAIRQGMAEEHNKHEYNKVKVATLCAAEKQMPTTHLLRNGLTKQQTATSHWERRVAPS